jgi:hypothetical protein
VRKTPLGISLSPFYAQTENSLREILENVISDFQACDVQICLPIENSFTLKVENKPKIKPKYIFSDSWRIFSNQNFCVLLKSKRRRKSSSRFGAEFAKYLAWVNQI